MIKRDELKGPSCLTSAAEDEPIFVLRSSDELAPEIVREWAARYFYTKDRQPGGITPKQRAKHDEARLLATKMLRYQQERLAASATDREATDREAPDHE